MGPRARNNSQSTGQKKQYYSSLSTPGNHDSDSTSSDDEETAVADHHGDDDDHVCLICAENIKIASLSSCNHAICHLCSYRNIALYKKDQCLVCRTEKPGFIFTENLNIAKYENIKKSDLLPSFKDDHGVRYTSDFAKKETLRLMEYVCPVKACTSSGNRMKNFKELNNHVKEVHNKFYCELCAKFKKAFIVELPLLGRKQLIKHQTKGDGIGFKGHPECKFCSQKRFYSEDELNVHLRDSHEKCHVCQQLDSSNPQYFRNYDHLFQHFQSAHYTCNVQTCLDHKFVVFADEFELQTHLVTEHSAMYGNNLLFGGNSSFGSQLFTVSSKKKTAKKEETDFNTHELKKKRLEERAKHYLNYSQDEFNRFLTINTKYSSGSIGVDQLVEEYYSIFKNSKDVDFDLLVYELAGLLPNNSKSRKNLEAIYKPQMDERDHEEKFPLLPKAERALDTSGWGQSNNSKSRSKLKLGNNGSFVDLPSLPKSNTPKFTNTNDSYTNRSTSKTNLKTRGISNNVPVNGYAIPGYNPISTNNKQSKPVWNTSNSNGSSVSLASSLSGSSTSLASKKNAFPALPTPAKKTFKAPVVASKPMNTNLFPSLPSTKPKKIIPRVNPVNNSTGVWGSTGSNALYASDDNSSFDMSDMGSSLKTVKKGKNGKKVVYQLNLN